MHANPGDSRDQQIAIEMHNERMELRNAGARVLRELAWIVEIGGLIGFLWLVFG